MRWLLSLGLVLAACSSSPQAPGRPPLVSETPPTTHDPGAVRDEPPRPSTERPERPRPAHDIEPRADGQPCLHASECQSGVCEGEGCGAGTPGRCMPAARACTRDLRPYCGCDGKTFRTSGSCPGRRFASRGECPVEPS